MGFLAFADDIALIATDFPHAQEMMYALELVLRRYGLELNINIANQTGRITY